MAGAFTSVEWWEVVTSFAIWASVAVVEIFGPIFCATAAKDFLLNLLNTFEYVERRNYIV
jgi:hypothetical protein